jgi:hypothetical protein
MRTCGALLFVILCAVAACHGAHEGDSCSDEGRIGGDCKEGLLCARSKPDDTSPLVCLVPCDGQQNCAENESCTGDRGRDQQACRPK